MLLRTLTRNTALGLTDRFLDAAYYPMRAWNRRRAEVPVTILTYHKISRAAVAGWNVSPENFAKQMDFLRSGGYTVSGLNDYLNKRTYGHVFRQPTVILTFDDGYENIFRNAYPVLARNRIPATVFLVPGLIGSNCMFPWDVGKEDYRDELLPLTWNEVASMHEGLIEFGSHTLTHPHLARLAPDDIERELVESKRRLEERLGVIINTFAYPGGIGRYGDFSLATREAVMRAGYNLACTSEIGRNTAASDLLQLRRIFVQGSDSLRTFAAKVEGAFDWMYYGQRVFQRVFPDSSAY
jgi:peptidoglycan/xylan/chitin deacetylase (PgdA/CDA1 family)